MSIRPQLNNLIDDFISELEILGKTQGEEYMKSKLDLINKIMSIIQNE